MAALSILLLAGALTSPPDQSVRAAPRTPYPSNVLIVVADDLGVDMVGAYGEGGDPPATPTMDTLAAGGVLFQNAWASPLCSTARATIVTGRYGFRTGIGSHVSPSAGSVALRPEEVTIPEMLELGAPGRWASAAFGKWHLGNGAVGGLLAPNVAGFDNSSGSLSAITRYYDWPKIVDGTRYASTTYATTDTVDSALSWLATAPEPWLCYVAFNAPHTPFHAPPAHLHSVDLSGANPDPDLEPLPYFRAAVEAMDSEMGRLLASIDPAVLGRTTVMFLGDNGTPSAVTVPPFVPEHAKQSLYEGGINVPLVVWGAGVSAPGGVSEALVHTTDLFATVAEVAGIDLSTTMPGTAIDGVSLMPYLSEPATPSVRTTVFSELYYPNGIDARTLPECGIFPGESSARRYCEEDMGSHVVDPIPIYGGTVMYPIATAKLILTDAQGRLERPLGISQTFGQSLVQVVVDDPAQPHGYGFSNVIRAVPRPWDGKAIRNARYKLMSRSGASSSYSLFDLVADPFEQNDLLLGSPNALETQNLLALRARLEELLSSP